MLNQMHSTDYLNIIHFFITGVNFYRHSTYQQYAWGPEKFILNILVGKVEGKTSLPRQRHKWEGEIKMVAKDMFGVDSTGR